MRVILSLFLPNCLLAAWRPTLVSSFTTPTLLPLPSISQKQQHASAVAVAVGVGVVSTSKSPLILSASSTEAPAQVEKDDNDEQELTDKGLLKRDRYIATNRFAVRPGKAAKFEKRWATRKSRLASLDGFKYFHLMRRVEIDSNDENKLVYSEGSDKDSSQGNYVSFTIWEKKSHFSAWRKGDAFKEAHGGTSITAFLSTMVSSAMVLRGAPRPAFYDGLLLQSTVPKEIPETVNGWRDVSADGINTLPPECFVACNQFFVPPENSAAFEQLWANRESKLAECDGFVAFSMLRRDGTAKGHGTSPMTENEPTYQSTTIWKDYQSFQNWRKGTAFQKAHGGGGGGDNNNSNEKNEPPKKPLWSKPPKPIFYEGTLVISSKDGA